MNIIITGGTGLIGRKLTQALVDRGHSVILLSRNPAGKAGRLPGGVSLAKWDGKTANGWGHLVNESDAIINLAGENLSGDRFPPKRWTEARKKLLRGSRVAAGQAVVEALRAAEKKPGVVIQASAIGYYGPQGENIVLESHPAGSDYLSQLCVDWENTTKPVAEMGIRHVIARIGLVMSLDGGALPNLLLPFKLFAGGPMGSGQQLYSWIHIDDLVRGIVFLLENENLSGVFNLTGPDPIPNKEIADIIGQVMRRPSFIPVPAFALRAALGEVSTVVLDGQRAVPENLRAAGFGFTYETFEAALRDLLDR
nr:TIGR01777 family oxidoreductase [Anaerolineae bacterium]